MKTEGGTMVRASLRNGAALALLMLAGLLCGCAPVWTNLKQDSALEFNGTKNVCLRPTTGAIPYDCIAAAREEMIELQIDAGRYNKGLAYTSVIGGTYAGYQASRAKPNTALLKHAAIGVAALVGLDNVVDADQQLTVLDAGIVALNCVRQAADAIDKDTIAVGEATNVPVTHSSGIDRSGAVARIRNDANTSTPVRQIPALDAAEMKLRVAGLVGGAPVASVSTPAERKRLDDHLGPGLALLVDAKVNHMNAVNADWNDAAVSAKSEAARRVYESVLRIRQEVRRYLMRNQVDILALYKMQQEEVGKLITELATTAKTQTEMADSMEAIMGDMKLPRAGAAATDAFSKCIVDIKSSN